MDTNDDFLWVGLRARVERMGRVRPRTIELDAVGQRHERTHLHVHFSLEQPAVHERIHQEPAHAPDGGTQLVGTTRW